VKYRLILRFLIDPNWLPEERLEELVRFCVEARVEEVMLLVQAEELSPGHPIEAEWDEWIALAVRVRERLAVSGIALSLNPWATIYAVTRGRRTRLGHDFQRMVGESGIEHPLAACPLCPKWQAFIAHCFARLAVEVRPSAIWVEDDWRLHNHGASLGWGGCFCPIHLNRFSEFVGEGVSREQVLEAVLCGGDPHPWRDTWLKLLRDSILEPSRVLALAVKEANPDVRLGLMSSLPDQHSAEGRDWTELREALGMGETFLIRPHMPPYTQQWPLRVSPWPTRHTLACLEGRVESYPELENSPRCGIYSKSARATLLQMHEAAVLGSPGITLNHFDNTGNGIALDSKIGPAIGRVRCRLDAVRALQLDDRRAEGVQVLFSPKIAGALRLSAGEVSVPSSEDFAALNRSLQSMSGAAGGGIRGSLQALVHSSMIWSEVCAILGIAHRITSSIEIERGPIMISGQTLEAFDDTQVRYLLGGHVVLDAVAAEGLVRRGFAAEIGLQGGSWQTLEEAGFSYEQIVDDDADCFGLAYPRMTAQRNADRVWKMRMLPGGIERSTFFNGESHRLFPASVEFQNPLGGRVLTLAYPLDGGAQFFMGFFNTFRRRFFEKQFCADPRGGKLAFGPEGTRFYRQSLADESTFLALINPTDDCMEKIEIRLTDEASSNLDGSWQWLDAEGHWRPIRASHQGMRLCLPVSVEHLSAVYLLHSQ